MPPDLLAAAAVLAAATLPPPAPACLGCSPGPVEPGPPAPSPPSSPAVEARGRWFAGAGGGWSTLSHGRSGTWRRREAFVGLRDGASAVTLSGEWQRRDGPTDITFSVRGDHGREGGSVYLVALATPHANFSERWGLRGGGELRLARRLDLAADARLSHYASGTSTALSAGPRLWTADRRASARLRGIAQWDEGGRQRFGWASDASFEASDAIHLATGLSRYPETDAGVTRRTRSAFASLAWRTDRSLTLRGAVEREERARSYRRDSVNLSVALDF